MITNILLSLVSLTLFEYLFLGKRHSFQKKWPNPIQTGAKNVDRIFSWKVQFTVQLHTYDSKFSLCAVSFRNCRGITVLNV